MKLVSEYTTLCNSNRLQEDLCELTSLLRSDLKNLASLLGNFKNLLPFADGQCERFFAVNMLAGPHRIDRNLGVPVIGRSNRDRIDVLPSDELKVVVINLAVSVISFGKKICIESIHVRDRYHVA